MGEMCSSCPTSTALPRCATSAWRTSSSANPNPDQVCDFGLAHLKLGSGVNTARHGSPSWTAPEVLKGEARDEKARDL